MMIGHHIETPMAVASDGTVWAWGENSAFEIGGPTAVDRPSPVQVPFPDGVKIARVASGSVSTELSYISLALDVEGGVWAWGKTSAAPIMLAGLSDIVDIGVGFSSCLALASDGTVYSWGSAKVHGHGAEALVSAPKAISGVSPAVQICRSLHHAALLTETGDMYTWGYGNSGRLGLNSTADVNVPTKVTFPSGTRIARIVLGGLTSYALDTNGIVWAWGSGVFGAVGDGTNGTDRLVPVKLTSLPKVGKLAAGDWTVMAVCANGEVYAWGDNKERALGLGSAMKSDFYNAPQKVTSAPLNILGIDGGHGRQMFLTEEGRVFLCGSIDYGNEGLYNPALTLNEPTMIEGFSLVRN